MKRNVAKSEASRLRASLDQRVLATYAALVGEGG